MQVKDVQKGLFGLLIIVIFFSIVLKSTFIVAGTPAAPENSDYEAYPPFNIVNAPPLVMLVMGRDHRNYYEAYTDTTDLNDDGIIDTTYNDAIDYYGYFDSWKCYVYDSTGTPKFVPTRVINPLATGNHHYCGGTGEWSGNFLNWLSMSRMDIIKKVLYGGHRSTDSSNETVLEGEYIPQDAHSWGKEYAGADVRMLTPFDPPTGAGSSVCTTPPGNVPWSQTGSSGILYVIYRDGVSKPAPTNHNEMLATYTPCSYKSHNYIGQINLSNSLGGDNGNYIVVTEFLANASGYWAFAIDGDDAVELEILDATTLTRVNFTSLTGSSATIDNGVLGWYGSHSSSGRIAYRAQINLTSGKWYRLIARHRDLTGDESLVVKYALPGSDFTKSSSYKVFGSVTGASALQLRSPNIDNPCRLKKLEFINNGEPLPGNTTVDCGGSVGTTKRHLFCMTSTSVDDAHKIRVLLDRPERAYNWASIERPVCGNEIVDTSGNRVPVTPIDYYVRVKVCDPSVGLERNCKQYGGNYKPTGLLQKYGEGPAGQKVCSKTRTPCSNDRDCGTTGGLCIPDARIYFGLLTGSYTYNMTGGVLRKNIWAVNDEPNESTGIFQSSENVGGNIILTLDRMKVIGFDYTNYSYGCVPSIDRMDETSTCKKMWGNPIGEMIYEATRYFADKRSPTSSYTYTSTLDMGLKLSKPTWNRFSTGSATYPLFDNPITGTTNGVYPSCSKPFIIILTDKNISYDSDDLPGSAFKSFTGDLPDLNVSTYANLIGTSEGIAGRSWIIGEANGVTDFICSAKSVTNLSNIRGLCPAEPTREGSYYSAAVAYYGHTQLKAKTGFPNIGYYSVVQESNVPDIEFKVDGKKVIIVPVGKSISGCSAYTSCYSKCTITKDADGLHIVGCSGNSYCPTNQIVDFYIDKIVYDNSNNPIYMKFFVNYEDSEHGSDHDMDSIVSYEICTKAAETAGPGGSALGNCGGLGLQANQIRIILTSLYGAGCVDQVLGFIIKGTDSDGVYLPIKDGDVPATTDTDTPSNVATLPTMWGKTFNVTGTSAGVLKDPLWYVSKWGNFTDKDGDGKPSLQSEWDENGDGVPDSYFRVTNPLYLEKKLEDAFLDILKRTSSGTAVSVLASSAEGEGALFQAFFKPAIEGVNGTVSWVGYLHGLFIDPYGNIREDTNQDGKLELTIDRILKFKVDPVSNDTVAEKYADSNGDGVPDSNTPESTVPLTDVKSLWEAGKRLALKSPEDRNLFTSINGTESGRIDFDALNASTLRDYLRAGSDAEAAKIIRFIRGDPVDIEDPSYRSRTVNIGGANYVWKLGDIVYSTPTVVAAPMENYDLIYGDQSYYNYYKAHKDRISVVYAGSNDGVLHAFYAGKFNQGDDPTTLGVENGYFTNPLTGVNLGDELWGYIPMSFLPHLQWQTKVGYKHVYGIDLKPKVFDAKIFTPDTDHVEGWGTILIGGMRLGGGEIQAKIGTTIKTFYSSYFALDITNPLQPKVLWEFSHPDLGLTLSYPCIVKRGNNWYAIFGSGPEGGTANKDSLGYFVRSSKNAKIFVVRINGDNSNWVLNSNYWILDTGITSGFVGSPVSIDVDLDGNSDVVYTGVVQGTFVPTQAGYVFSLITNTDTPSNWTLKKVFTAFSNVSPRHPLVNAPAIGLRDKDLWIYISSGRFFHANLDKSLVLPERMYGFKDPCFNGGFDTSCSTQLTESNLINMSNVVIRDMDNDGVGETVTGFTGATTFQEMLTSFKNSLATGSAYGWYSDMVDNGERGVSKPVFLGDVVLFTTYLPMADICQGGGYGYLYALYALTGTAYQKPLIGYNASTKEIYRRTGLGGGTPSSISVHLGREKGGKAFIQQSTGAIITVEFQTAAQAKSGYVLWMEKW